MSLKEISNGIFNQFIKNPRRLDLFLLYRNVNRLNTNIEIQAKLDNQQTRDLGV